MLIPGPWLLSLLKWALSGVGAAGAGARWPCSPRRCSRAGAAVDLAGRAPR